MQRSLICTTLVVGLLASFPASALGSNQSDEGRHYCPTDSQLAMLIAASDVVLLARLDVPAPLFEEEAAKSLPGYLDIPFQTEEVLKGFGGNATVRYAPSQATYKPSPDHVLAYSGTPTLLFLTRSDFAGGELYFAGHSPHALAPVTEQSIQATRNEIARQHFILSGWQIDHSLPHYDEVEKKIRLLGHVRGTKQQEVFDDLISLGSNAVPAIIAQMDDRRTLRTPNISLPNLSPDAFEAMRHYGPKQVVDGLSAVLNQISGASFGSIYSGGSDQKRDAVVAGWRIYSADRDCPSSV